MWKRIFGEPTSTGHVRRVHKEDQVSKQTLNANVVLSSIEQQIQDLDIKLKAVNKNLQLVDARFTELVKHAKARHPTKTQDQLRKGVAKTSEGRILLMQRVNYVGSRKTHENSLALLYMQKTNMEQLQHTTQNVQMLSEGNMLMKQASKGLTAESMGDVLEDMQEISTMLNELTVPIPGQDDEDELASVFADMDANEYSVEDIDTATPDSTSIIANAPTVPADSRPVHSVPAAALATSSRTAVKVGDPLNLFE